MFGLAIRATKARNKRGSEPELEGSSEEQGLQLPLLPPPLAELSSLCIAGTKVEPESSKTIPTVFSTLTAHSNVW